MNAYLQILRLRSAQILLVSAFPARLAYGMISLGIYFKVQSATGSIGVAGLAVGLNGLAGALTAGIRGALLDKYGMKWPLRIFVPLYGTLILIFNSGTSASYLVITATILGFTAPPINLSVRPLWKVTVREDQIRTAYAIDTAMMNAVGVLGPVVVTALALSSSPYWALGVCAICMYLGGFALMSTRTVRTFIPEKREHGGSPLWKIPALQILAIEGAFIGLGWGAFDIGVPAYTTIRQQPHLAGTILAIMGASNVLGGLLAGLISRKTSSLAAARRIYTLWFICSLPLAFTVPGWSMAIVTALLGLLGGGLQVFYWEITEAVRPKGASSGTMGWLWSIEGSCAAAGSAMGGYVSEHLSPAWCLGTTSIAIGCGLTVLTLGRKKLAAADKVPSDIEDTAALGDVISSKKS